ncbi:sugar phosphate isomerase/epimerase [Halorussus gelatinilyticus]|uniref:Sugar phosphate isomerase/epimerase n=1 Tax=Halorussus gelatinilyticus TaxID=2937524 RepID=A0A8U0IJ17_9EURY|nr:sugar phosphate isomerase/epimerase [Halorussus gelatinilyticus]UPW00686.1 sugar phosphate isomerase/epimerase [Halorussus gelatinilyticus]
MSEGERRDDADPRTVRRGYVTQTHTGAVPWDDALRAASRIGFDFAELYLDGATERTRIDPNAVGSLAAEADLDLLVHLPFVDLEIGSPRDPVREGSLSEQRACIEVASEMGAEKAVLHAGTSARPPEWELDEIAPHLLDSVRVLDRFAADRDVEICVENLPGVPFTVHHLDRVFAETEASATFDTGHARVDGLDAEEMADFLDAHGDRVSHVHVNDAREDADEHVPTGSGTTDFETALAPLREGWTGTVSVEVYTFDFDYLELSAEKLDEFL